MTETFWIGGIASVIARTTTAPIELAKIQQQNSFFPQANIGATWRAEGIRGLFKGNLATCMRIFPKNATQVWVFHHCESAGLSPTIAGAIAGAVSITTAYPLETIATRMALQLRTQQKYRNILEPFKQPWRILYQGYFASITGYIPFTAINFGVYKHLRKTSPDLPIWLAGSLAGSTAIAVIHPTDTIRRRLQLQGFDPSVPRYTGLIDCARTMLQKEGVASLYRGFPLACMRMFPMMGVQFWTMETLTHMFANT